MAKKGNAGHVLNNGAAAKKQIPSILVGDSLVRGRLILGTKYTGRSYAPTLIEIQSTQALPRQVGLSFTGNPEEQLVAAFDMPNH